MYNNIKLKKYNDLISNYNFLYLDYLISTNNYILFFNYNQISNFKLLNIKNEISKIGGFVFCLNTKIINKLFSSNFYFLKGFTIAIFINDFTKFINIVKELNNINFYFTFKKRFSVVLNKATLINQYEKFKNFTLLHFIIFKILYNIIILILYFIILLVKFLNIKI